MRQGKFNLPTIPEFSESTAEVRGIVRQDDEKRNESSGTCYRAKARKRQYSVNICSGNFTGNKARKVGHVGTMYYTRKAIFTYAF